MLFNVRKCESIIDELKDGEEDLTYKVSKTNILTLLHNFVCLLNFGRFA